VITTPRPIRIAIVGYGVAGKFFHGQLLKGLPQLFTITEVVSRNSAQVTNDLTSVKVVESIQQIQDAECVVIATPTHTHYSLAHEALERNFHVVVDKPFTTTTAEAKTLISKADQQKRVLTVFQNRRWDNGFLTARSLLGKGALGEIIEFRAHFDRYRPTVLPERWREQDLPGSGMLYDLGSHLLDQAICILGTPETWEIDTAVQRAGATQLDYFQVTLRYGNKRAILGASNVMLTPRPYIQLIGTEATYIKTHIDPQEHQLRSGISPDSPVWGKEPPEHYGNLLRPDATRTSTLTEPISSEVGSYDEFYRRLYHSIRDSAPPPVDAAGVIPVLEIIQSVSAKTKNLSQA
jgi:scyllo-inositol 2-dehydrogenase (NADP+)